METLIKNKQTVPDVKWTCPKCDLINGLRRCPRCGYFYDLEVQGDEWQALSDSCKEVLSA
jgi:rubredoxin